MFQEWDLVITRDGYYAIVINPIKREIFTAAGLVPVLSQEDFDAMTPLPLNVNGNCAKASFIGIEHTRNWLSKQQ